MTKAIFIDRDGVIVEDPGYVHKVEDFKLVNNAIEGLKLLKNYKLFIITNQSGIGRGYYSEDQFHQFNNHLLRELKKEGIYIIETWFCPHHPDEGCDCRKPNTKFMQLAAKKYNIELNKSFVIGDHPSDVEMGHKAGAKTIYVLTGHGQEHKENLKKYDYIAQDLIDAAKWILENDKE